jgi:hypothetical protein
MALEFRSSIPEVIAMTERGTDGRERIITATRDPNVTGVTRWDLELTHPSGWTKRAAYTGPRVGVGAAMDAILADTRREFGQEGMRGDRETIELHPLRGSVGVPGSPVISMPTGSVRR